MPRSVRDCWGRILAVCGRFALSIDAETLARYFCLPELGVTIEPRYNIAPSQPVPVIRLDRDGERKLHLLRWGLIPHWAKDAAIGNRLINARAETVATKPAFRSAFERRRCLIVAEGFYEWKRLDSGKQPYFIRRAAGEPMAFAGLWERWRPPPTEPGRQPPPTVDSCTIITTEANEAVRPIHGRMPALLEPRAFDRWLARTGSEPDELLGELHPCPSEALDVYPVSTHVNRPANDDPACIRPL